MSHLERRELKWQLRRGLLVNDAAPLAAVRLQLDRDRGSIKTDGKRWAGRLGVVRLGVLGIAFGFDSGTAGRRLVLAGMRVLHSQILIRGNAYCWGRHGSRDDHRSARKAVEWHEEASTALGQLTPRTASTVTRMTQSASTVAMIALRNMQQ